eukprot:637375-Pyramimonas_sp.AAC.1
MMRSGQERFTAAASFGGITSTAPELLILCHSLSSDISNLLRSAGESLPRDTSPPRPAAKISRSGSGPGTSVRATPPSSPGVTQ